MKKRFALAAGLVVAVLTITAYATPTKWAIKADFIDSCSCHASCPCLMGSKPTQGYCEGAALIEITEGSWGKVKLDGVKVIVVYRSGVWKKFLVSDTASKEQTQAVVELLPTAVKFYAPPKQIALRNVPITVERGAEHVKITAENTTIDLNVMKGQNGKPIHLTNVPVHGFPAPEFQNHTQFKATLLEHTGADKSFKYTGNNAFTARIEASGEAGT